MPVYQKKFLVHFDEKAKSVKFNIFIVKLKFRLREFVVEFVVSLSFLEFLFEKSKTAFYIWPA